jgi:branched-chain amino acid transport system permease protein
MTTAAASGAPARGGRLVIVRGSATHRIIQLVCVVAVVAFVFWGGGLEPFGQGQLTRAGIFALAILGLNFTTGYVGLLSVGHSAFLGLGAYTTGILIVKYNQTALSTLPWSMLICFVVGLVVGIPALRIRGLYLAMVTLALGVAFPEVVARLDGLTSGAEGMTIRRTLLRPPEWSGFSLGEKDVWLYWLMVVVLAVCWLVVRNIIKSRYGLAMQAVRQDEVAASASGINVAAIKIMSFGVSGAITGLAGSLFAMYIGSLFAEGSFTVLAGITLLIGLVLGGERTLIGPLLGGLAVVMIPYYTSDWGQGQGSAVLFAIVLIAVIFVAPEGIAGGLARVGRRFVTVADRRPDSSSEPPHPDPAPVEPRTPVGVGDR